MLSKLVKSSKLYLTLAALTVLTACSSSGLEEVDFDNLPDGVLHGRALDFPEEGDHFFLLLELLDFHVLVLFSGTKVVSDSARIRQKKIFYLLPDFCRRYRYLCDWLWQRTISNHTSGSWRRSRAEGRLRYGRSRSYGNEAPSMRTVATWPPALSRTTWPPSPMSSASRSSATGGATPITSRTTVTSMATGSGRG